MSNSVIGALRVMLGMDTAQFEQGVDRTAREAKRLESQLQKTSQNLNKIGRSLATALTAPLLAIGGAGAAAVNQLASDAERMRLAAQNAGTGFEEFQRAAHAAYTGAGIESEKFGDILRDTQDKIGDFAATGGGELKDFFDNIAAPQGLGIEDFIGKSSVEQLKLFVSALERAGVPSEQMVFYLESLADEGSALYHILKNNGAALDELGKKAAVIDPKARAELEAYTDAQKQLDTSTRKLTIALAKSGLIEAMTELVERVASFTARFAEANPNLFKFTVIAGGVAAALGPVALAFSGLLKLAPLLSTAFGVIRVAAVALMAHPVLLAFSGVIAGIYAVWKHWDKIEPILRNLYNGVKKWLLDKLGAVFKWVTDKVDVVTGAFEAMYVAVVGNSYVPDMVDGIAQEFARLQLVMVDPALKAASDTKEAFRQLASDVGGLLDRLFPQIAEARRQAEELALLDKAAEQGLISDDLRKRARMRVLGGGRDRATVSDWLTGNDPLVDIGAQLQGLQDQLGETAEATEVQTVRIADTFQQMVDRVLGAVRGLVEGFKKGDFVSILQGVWGVFSQVGQTGAFGKGVQNFLQKVPGFAQGGAMTLGGIAGIDRNILSLNGSPIARVSAGETMQIRRGDAGGGARQVVVRIVDTTGLFKTEVEGAAMRVVSAASPAIARAGAGLAIDRIRQAQGQALA